MSFLHILGQHMPCRGSVCALCLLEHLADKLCLIQSVHLFIRPHAIFRPGRYNKFRRLLNSLSKSYSNIITAHMPFSPYFGYLEWTPCTVLYTPRCRPCYQNGRVAGQTVHNSAYSHPLLCVHFFFLICIRDMEGSSSEDDEGILVYLSKRNMWYLLRSDPRYDHFVAIFFGANDKVTSVGDVQVARGTMLTGKLVRVSGTWRASLHEIGHLESMRCDVDLRRVEAEAAMADRGA